MKRNPKYYIIVEYNNYDSRFDRKLETLLGRESSGSGYGMGIRDMSFDYFRIDAAKRALKTLKRIKKHYLKAKLAHYQPDDF